MRSFVKLLWTLINLHTDYKIANIQVNYYSRVHCRVAHPSKIFRGSPTQPADARPLDLPVKTELNYRGDWGFNRPINLVMTPPPVHL